MMCSLLLLMFYLFSKCINDHQELNNLHWLVVAIRFVSYLVSLFCILNKSKRKPKYDLDTAFVFWLFTVFLTCCIE